MNQPKALVQIVLEVTFVIILETVPKKKERPIYLSNTLLIHPLSWFHCKIL